MVYIVNAVLVFLLVFIIRIVLTKSYLTKSEELLSYFQVGNTRELSNFEYKQLVKNAGIPAHHFTEHVDGGLIPPEKLDNLFPCEELKELFEKRLIAVCDVCFRRYKQNFSLTFWIEFLVFLPKHILVYLGVNEDNISTRIVNVLYWIGALLSALVKTSLVKFFQHFFHI